MKIKDVLSFFANSPRSGRETQPQAESPGRASRRERRRTSGLGPGRRSSAGEATWSQTFPHDRPRTSSNLSTGATAAVQTPSTRTDQIPTVALEEFVQEQPPRSFPRQTSIERSIARSTEIDSISPPTQEPSGRRKLPELTLEIPAQSLRPITQWEEEDWSSSIGRLRSIDNMIQEQHLPKLSKDDLVESDVLFYEVNDGKKPSSAGTPKPDTERKTTPIERNAVRLQKIAKSVAPGRYEHGDPRMRHVLMWAPDSSGNEIIQANFKKKEPDRQKVLAKPLTMPGRYIVYRHENPQAKAHAVAFAREAAELGVPYDRLGAATLPFRSSTPAKGCARSQPPSPRSPDTPHDPYYSCSHLISRSFQLGISQIDDDDSSSSLLLERKPKNISPFKLHHIMHSPDSGFKAIGYIDIGDQEKESVGGPSLYIEKDSSRPNSPQ